MRFNQNSFISRNRSGGRRPAHAGAGPLGACPASPGCCDGRRPLARCSPCWMTKPVRRPPVRFSVQEAQRQVLRGVVLLAVPGRWPGSGWDGEAGRDAHRQLAVHRLIALTGWLADDGSASPGRLRTQSRGVMALAAGLCGCSQLAVGLRCAPRCQEPIKPTCKLTRGTALVNMIWQYGSITAYFYAATASYWVQLANTRPGFMMPCGSSAVLICRISCKATGDLYLGSDWALRLPTPCSAEMEPPCFINCS